MQIVDMHCDTIVRMFKKNQHLDSNNLHLDVQKMKKSNYLLQNMAIFLDCTKEEKPNVLAKEIIKFYEEETFINDINKVKKYSDIDFNKINSMLTIEDSSIVPFNELEDFYNLGVRMITLTWNYPNLVGYPNLDGYNLNTLSDMYRVDNENGLTEFGKKYVKKMNDLNIIVDVSHGSNKLVEDVLSLSDIPFVASHSNCFSISPVGRNLNDNLIRKMIEKDCVIGMNLLTEFVNDKATISTIDDIIKHVDHILDLGGENSIGFGFDLDGIDSTIEIVDSSNAKLIVDRLNKRYSKEIVNKITYENVLNLYKKILK
ncbi:MAG: dipeptidase [Pleomorphochaeta sp.]